MAGLSLTNMISGAAQGVLGIGQMIGGLTMPKPEIPDYEIPEEIYKNMTDAEYWSFQGLPEAQKQQFIEQSQRAGATALSRSAERKGGLGLVASVAQQEQDAATQLLSMDAQQRMQNLQNLYRMREVMAEQKGTQQQWKMDKVMYQRQKRDEMIGAGMQNLGQSFSTFVGAGGGGQTPGAGGKTSFQFSPSSTPKLTNPIPANMSNPNAGIFNTLSGNQAATLGGPASSQFSSYMGSLAR